MTCQSSAYHTTDCEEDAVIFSRLVWLGITSVGVHEFFLSTNAEDEDFGASASKERKNGTHTIKIAREEGAISLSHTHELNSKGKNPTALKLQVFFLVPTIFMCT